MAEMTERERIARLIGREICDWDRLFLHKRDYIRHSRDSPEKYPSVDLYQCDLLDAADAVIADVPGHRPANGAIQATSPLRLSREQLAQRYTALAQLITNDIREAHALFAALENEIGQHGEQLEVLRVHTALIERLGEAALYSTALDEYLAGR